MGRKKTAVWWVGAVGRWPALLAGAGARSLARATVVAAVVCLAGLGAIAATQYIIASVRHSSRFRMPLERINYTPLPIWMRADLLAEVQYLAALPAELNTADPGLADRLRDAFSMHPWVQRVRSVTIEHPDRVHLELVYREPVALVRTAGGLEPIDAGGVLLPSASLAHPLAYLVVTGIKSGPTGPPGTLWDDEAVRAAAATAAALSPHHRRLGLTTMDLSAYRPTVADSDEVYLLTERGTRVKWGRPPFTDHPGEVPVRDKLKRLTEYVSRHGSLDAPAGPYEIDITQLAEITVRSRSE